MSLPGTKKKKKQCAKAGIILVHVPYKWKEEILGEREGEGMEHERTRERPPPSS
jgi:hypothetical protein